MSSTTDASAKGQALALFALSLTAVLLAGALAFDGGLVFLERRDEQNAADAAALAGARYLTTNTSAARSSARSAAYEIATENGFTDGVNSASVVAHVPPVSGPNAGRPGYIEVQISSTRPSFFAGLAGIAHWDVGARAVGLNGDGAGGGFALLSLNPQGCDALKVTGTGSVDAWGDIQVNSTCNSGALRAGGGGTVEVIDVDSNGYACNVVGAPPFSILPDESDGAVNCEYNMGAVPVDDPLAGLEEPTRPELATPPLFIKGDGGNKEDVIPDGCPGADKKPSSWESPQLCAFANAAYIGTTWRLYPGLYPGGLDLNDATFELMPGIYYIAGGGLSAGGDASIHTVDSSGNLDLGLGLGGTAAGGVMFFNTDHPSKAWAPIVLNGGGSGFDLLPLDASSLPNSAYNGLLIFNDRDFPGPSKPSATAIQLNGGGADFVARGTIYTATGLITVNGNSAGYDFIIDQAIAYDYSLTGNDGSIEVLMNTEFLYKLRAAGLVE